MKKPLILHLDYEDVEVENIHMKQYIPEPRAVCVDLIGKRKDGRSADYRITMCPCSGYERGKYSPMFAKPYRSIPDPISCKEALRVMHENGMLSDVGDEEWWHDLPRPIEFNMKKIRPYLDEESKKAMKRYEQWMQERGIPKFPVKIVKYVKQIHLTRGKDDLNGFDLSVIFSDGSRYDLGHAISGMHDFPNRTFVLMSEESEEIIRTLSCYGFISREGAIAQRPDDEQKYERIRVDLDMIRPYLDEVSEC